VETLCPPGDVTVAKSGTTGLDGSTTVSFRSSSKGVYTSTVTDVTHRARTYNPDDNVVDTGMVSIP
jgi:hypothetical protein